MDGLSAAASVIAVLQLTTTVLGYLKDIKDVSEDHVRMRSVLRSANEIFGILTSKANAPEAESQWSETFMSLCMPDGPLKQFEATLRIIEKKLKPVHGPKKVVKAFI